MGEIVTSVYAAVGVIREIRGKDNSPNGPATAFPGSVSVRCKAWTVGPVNYSPVKAYRSIILSAIGFDPSGVRPGWCTALVQGDRIATGQAKLVSVVRERAMRVADYLTAATTCLTLSDRSGYSLAVEVHRPARESRAIYVGAVTRTGSI